MPHLLPIRDHLGDTGPAGVTALIADVVDLAVTARNDLIHPNDLVLGANGRPELVPSAARFQPSVATAPEMGQSGPTPATLVFTAAAIGVIAALGSLDPAPSDPAAFARWHAEVARNLRERWGPLQGAAPAIEWIGRCLAFDPFERPKPHQLLEVLPRDPAPLPTTTTTHTRPTPSTSGPTLRPVRRPPANLYLQLAALLSVLSLAVATCALGAVLGHWTGSAATPAPRVEPAP